MVIHPIVPIRRVNKMLIHHNSRDASSTDGSPSVAIFWNWNWSSRLGLGWAYEKESDFPSHV